VQIVVNTEDGTSTVTPSKTCLAGTGACAAAFEWANKVQVGVGEDGTIGVNYRLHNGISALPAIDGSIAITPDGNGGYESHGSRDAFPSIGIYQWDGQKRTTIREKSEGSPKDLVDARNVKDQW
jgi:hypothetical protein